MSNYTLTGMNISSEEFLGAFFQAQDTVCIRVFSDKPGSAFAGIKMETTQGHFDKIANELHNHNAQGRGIYFTINFGGHEDAAIKRINAQFMECDDLPLQEQLIKIQEFPIEPSLIVKTCKSLHCYWLIKEGKIDKFRHVQKQLVAHFNADPKCINESRVFRIPGFYHCKEAPVMVEIIKYNPELRYTQDELSAILPEIPEDNPYTLTTADSSSDRGKQMGLKVVGLKCQFIKHCNKNAKTLSEPDWYAMITNLAVFKGGDAAIHKLSKPYPKYSF